MALITVKAAWQECTREFVATCALLGGEVAAGQIIGVVLAALVFAGVIAAFGDMALAVTVAISILPAGTIATTVGLSLPWTLIRAGLDPAFGSGPLATVIQDLLSILIYFACVMWLMRCDGRP